MIHNKQQNYDEHKIQGKAKIKQLKTERKGKSTREGAQNDVGRRERRKRGRGMKERDERSKGTEIRIPDTFAMIKPTAPFKLAKHTTLRKRN